MFYAWMLDQLRLIYQIANPHPYLSGTPDPISYFNEDTEKLLDNIVDVDAIESRIDKYFNA